MDIVSWKESYSVGNEEIDCEHKVFVTIIQRIHESVRDGDHRRVARLFAELVKYADFHFLSEENIMHDVGYPEADAHRAEHCKLLATLRSKLDGIRAGKEVVAEIVPFVLEWFVSHTTKRDLLLARSIAALEGKQAEG